MSTLQTLSDRALMLIIVLAVLARIASAAMLGDSLFFDDETVYLDAAQSLVEKGEFDKSYRREPAYPVFLAVSSLLVPDRVLFIRLVQAVVVGLGCLLLFQLGSDLFGRRAGIGAALFYALDPLLVVSGSLLYSEALAAVVLLGCLLAARRASRDGLVWQAMVCGLLLALVTLMRQVGAVLILPIAAWLLVNSPGSMSRRVVRVGALVAVFAISLTPWVYRNYQIFGRLGPLAPAGFSSTLEPLRDVAPSEGYARSVVAWAWSEPREVARRVGRNFLRVWEPFPTFLAVDNPETSAKLHASNPRLPKEPRFPMSLRNVVSSVSFGFELLLAIVGVVIGWRTRSPEILFLVLILICYSLGYSLFEGRIRFRIPVLPEFLLLTGLGFGYLVDRLTRWRVRA